MKCLSNQASALLGVAREILRVFLLAISDFFAITFGVSLGPDFALGFSFRNGLSARARLDKKIQGALSRVRMVGNDAVEPGMIDAQDDEETARGLFEILNLIVDALIAQPRRVDEMLGKLPRREGE